MREYKKNIKIKECLFILAVNIIVMIMCVAVLHLKACFDSMYDGMPLSTGMLSVHIHSSGINNTHYSMLCYSMLGASIDNINNIKVRPLPCVRA